MCGIAGILTTDHAMAAPDAVERMVHHLRHRGPDGCGIEMSTTGATCVALGHTRLAIIDLSDAGRQPMRSSDGTHVVTFNGEIYNFREIRAQVDGPDWQSQSDTEVLVEAYARWGSSCLERLRGMFAFGIWDGNRSELFLARDRLGIKPLYYYAADGLFVFASEVRALLASGLVPRRLDPVGLAEYLAYQSVPAPRTMIEGVNALPPGHALRVDRHCRATQQRYWDMLEHAALGAADEGPLENRRRVGDILHEAVELHMVSDVPVGAFLSGGIDSSAVVGLMREAGYVPHTFSVGFAERAYDETNHARRIAGHFRTEHTEILLRERDLLDQLPDAMSAMDQPTGDGINTYVVSRAVRGSGIKVALSGLGGDELFAGYPSFRRLSRAASFFRAWARSPRPMRTLAAQTVSVLGGTSVAAAKAAAMMKSGGGLANLYPLTRQVLSSGQRRSLLTKQWSYALEEHVDPYVELLETAYRDGPDAGVLTSISYAEGRTYMHDVLLRDTDQMSMAHALEVRVPLLDHRLVEYVMGVPDAQKHPRGTPKRLLVESLNGLVPGEAVQRRKQGFTLPFAEWMRGELQDFCEERLGPRGLAGRDIFQPMAVQDLWSRFLDRRADTTWSRAWVLVALEDWLERNGF